MIKSDFERMHNAIGEALNAIWCLLWSIIIAVLHYLMQGSIWMRNLADPAKEPAWITLAHYEPIIEQAGLNLGIFRGNEILKEESILSDLEVYY